MQEKTMVRASKRLYALGLHLYPKGFRNAFGPQMQIAFEEWIDEEARDRGLRGLLRVWRTTLLESLPTLLREHSDAIKSAGGWGHPIRLIGRLMFAGSAPVAAFVALVRMATGPIDVAAIAFWFAMMFAGITLARGRGWKCHRNAVIGGVIGVALPIVAVATVQTTTPNAILLIPLLGAAAATIGLILSTYVRAVIEGVSPRSARSHDPAAAHLA